MKHNTNPQPTCLLCGKPSNFQCLFIPEDSTRFFAPAGKTRVFNYGLCKDCKSLPEDVRHVLVESHLPQRPEWWTAA